MKLYTLSVVVMLCLAGCENAGRSDRSRQEMLSNYRGHQVAVWTFRQGAEAPVGFAKGQLAPGQNIELEPVHEYRIAFALGQVGKSTFTDFHREWQEYTVKYTTSHGTGSAEGDLELNEARFNIEWGNKEPYRSIMFACPIGELAPEKFRKILGAGLRGELAEL